MEKQKHRDELENSFDVLRLLDKSLAGCRTFNLEQTADFLKVSPETARRMFASGEVPGVRVKHNWVTLDLVLAEWLIHRMAERSQANSEVSDTVEAPTPRRRGRQRKALPELP